MKKYIGIDLSSKTGFVSQSESKILVAEEYVYRYKKDPERMIYIVDKIFQHIDENTIVGIEGFAYSAGGNSHDFQYGLGWIVRYKLKLLNIPYYEITTQQLKKFATGHGNIKKKETLIEPIKRRWGFYHPSDNITDAFILSEIVKAIDLKDKYENLREHEKQVISAVQRSLLNSQKLIESDIPSWRSKAFNEQKRAEKEPYQQLIEQLKDSKRAIKSEKGWSKNNALKEEIMKIDTEIKNCELMIKDINSRKIKIDWE